jgi:outer membrane protein assembly factor BamD
MVRYIIRYVSFVALLAAMMVSFGCRKKVYENPITKDTQQPDKVLYDTAIDDIEHGRYERSRLTLQTLMNTYDTSEFLAKAKLAMADSWYREGGARGMAQAEAEYKDFILFYKTMEEAAEAQMKICKMQYDQMDKGDRDPHHALRAQEECKQLLLEFPNSQYAADAAQKLRDIQEALAYEEARVEEFYWKKGSFPAAANRGQGLTDQFPLYSGAPEALWLLADSYQHLGTNFENQQAAAYAKIVEDYPLSDRAESAKLRLQAMNKPIPEVDPVAYAREKYELDNARKRGLLGKAWQPFSAHADLLNASRTGDPSLETLHPTIPVSVPLTAAGEQGTSAQPKPSVTVGGVGGSDVTGTIVQNTNIIDTKPDARLTETPASATPAAVPVAGGGAPAGGNTVTATPAGPTPAANGTPTPAAPDAHGPAAAPATTTIPVGKQKSLAQQEADLKREQDQMKKERQRNTEQQQKRLAEMQRLAKKQQAAQAKRKAEEDAERKKAADATAKKAKKQSSKQTPPPAAPATTPAPADKQPDKPAGTGGSGGGETPSAKQ